MQHGSRPFTMIKFTSKIPVLQVYSCLALIESAPHGTKDGFVALYPYLNLDRASKNSKPT